MTRQSVKKNLFYNMTYQVVILILPFITAPYLARVIGAEGVGTYSYLYSIALYFAYFAMLGISNYGNRQIAGTGENESEQNETFSSIYSFQLITSTIVTCAYLTYVCVFVKENQILALILGLRVLSTVFDVSWLFFGRQEFKITSVRQIIIRLVSFVAILTLVREKSDLWVYTLIMGLSYLISSFSLWVMMWDRIHWKKTKIGTVLLHFKPCMILFVPIIAASLYRVMDKIMIGEMCNLTEVGYYENAEKLITITMGLLFSFGTVLMPKISNLRGKGEDGKAKQLFNTAMETALCIGTAIAFGIGAVSKEFIPLYFGEDFSPAINLSIGLSVTVPFIAWAGMVRVLHLIPYEKDRVYVQSIVMGAIFNIVCNLLLIPRIGTMGAVIATLAAEISVAVYQTYKSREYLDIRVYLRQALIFCAFGVVMTIAVRLVASQVKAGVLGVALEILVGAAVYMALTLVYVVKTQNPIFLSIVEKMTKKRKK